MRGASEEFLLCYDVSVGTVVVGRCECLLANVAERASRELDAIPAAHLAVASLDEG